MKDATFWTEPFLNTSFNLSHSAAVLCDSKCHQVWGHFWKAMCSLFLQLPLLIEPERGQVGTNGFIWHAGYIDSVRIYSDILCILLAGDEAFQAFPTPVCWGHGISSKRVLPWILVPLQGPALILQWGEQRGNAAVFFFPTCHNHNPYWKTAFWQRSDCIPWKQLCCILLLAAGPSITAPRVPSPGKSWVPSHPSLRILTAKEISSAFFGRCFFNFCTQLVTSPTPTLYLYIFFPWVTKRLQPKAFGMTDDSQITSSLDLYS